MKKSKIVYLVSTGLITALMIMSVGMYIFKNAEISATFEALGHPSYLVYPLAAAKILGLIAIWTNKSKSLKEWAYAGFFFDFLLAFLAHYNAGDGIFTPSTVATVLILVSYFSWKKLGTANQA